MPAAPLILLVEDEAGFREPLEYLLRMRDFDVATASRADTALELMHQREPAAAIVDLYLEQGSGRDVIVRMPAKAPVIILSGRAAASGELERLRPRTRMVEKPASLTWVVNTLEAMLQDPFTKS